MVKVIHVCNVHYKKRHVFKTDKVIINLRD